MRHAGARVPMRSIPEVIEDGVTGKVVDSEEEAVAALPGILSYDRRAVRQRFEERFSATRMAKDYVRTYRQLLSMRTSDRRRRSPWLRRGGLNGGNGSTPMSVERPLPALAQAGANSEIDPIRMRVVDLSAMLPSRDPEAMRADENVIRVSAVGREIPDIE